MLQIVQHANQRFVNGATVRQGRIEFRETATTQVKVGDVAFWGAGGVLAIFFGRTPMSMGADPVPADRVNVVGRIVGDATVLRQAMGASTIRVEPAS